MRLTGGVGRLREYLNVWEGWGCETDRGCGQTA